jgi:hypothetical protein
MGGQIPSTLGNTATAIRKEQKIQQLASRILSPKAPPHSVVHHFDFHEDDVNAYLVSVRYLSRTHPKEPYHGSFSAEQVYVLHLRRIWQTFFECT